MTSVLIEEEKKERKKRRAGNELLRFVPQNPPGVFLEEGGGRSLFLQEPRGNGPSRDPAQGSAGVNTWTARWAPGKHLNPGENLRINHESEASRAANRKSRNQLKNIPLVIKESLSRFNHAALVTTEG